ncbi:MAG: glycosyltransferase [Terracoccus sp.]
MQPSHIAPVTELAVVVPARDEAALLPACLDALEVALGCLRHERPEVRATTTVVLDRCTDASARVVAERPWVDVVEIDAGCVGVARAVGISAATRLHEGHPPTDPRRVWVASTDADSVVPSHWLTRQLGFADEGVDAVVGTVDPDEHDLGTTLLSRWRSQHPAVEDHPHVHGANLGVRLSAYLAVGGFPPVRVHEDALLVDALRRAGHPTQATHHLPVRTSGRVHGRTPAGFAAYLRGLAADLSPGTPTAVPDA